MSGPSRRRRVKEPVAISAGLAVLDVALALYILLLLYHAWSPGLSLVLVPYSIVEALCLLASVKILMLAAAAPGLSRPQPPPPPPGYLLTTIGALTWLLGEACCAQHRGSRTVTQLILSRVYGHPDHLPVRPSYLRVFLSAVHLWRSPSAPGLKTWLMLASEVVLTLWMGALVDGRTAAHSQQQLHHTPAPVLPVHIGPCRPPVMLPPESELVSLLMLWALLTIVSTQASRANVVARAKALLSRLQRGIADSCLHMRSDPDVEELHAQSADVQAITGQTFSVIRWPHVAGNAVAAPPHKPGLPGSDQQANVPHELPAQQPPDDPTPVPGQRHLPPPFPVENLLSHLLQHNQQQGSSSILSLTCALDEAARHDGSTSALTLHSPVDPRQVHQTRPSALYGSQQGRKMSHMPAVFLLEVALAPGSTLKVATAQAQSALPALLLTYMRQCGGHLLDCSTHVIRTVHTASGTPAATLLCRAHLLLPTGSNARLSACHSQARMSRAGVGSKSDGDGCSSDDGVHAAATWVTKAAERSGSRGGGHHSVGEEQAGVPLLPALRAPAEYQDDSQPSQAASPLTSPFMTPKAAGSPDAAAAGSPMSWEGGASGLQDEFVEAQGGDDPAAAAGSCCEPAGTPPGTPPSPPLPLSPSPPPPHSPPGRGLAGAPEHTAPDDERDTAPVMQLTRLCRSEPAPLTREPDPVTPHVDVVTALSAPPAYAEPSTPDVELEGGQVARMQPITEESGSSCGTDKAAGNASSRLPGSIDTPPPTTPASAFAPTHLIDDTSAASPTHLSPETLRSYILVTLPVHAPAVHVLSCATTHARAPLHVPHSRAGTPVLPSSTSDLQTEPAGSAGSDRSTPLTPASASASAIAADAVDMSAASSAPDTPHVAASENSSGQQEPDPPSPPQAPTPPLPAPPSPRTPHSNSCSQIGGPSAEAAADTSAANEDAINALAPEAVRQSLVTPHSVMQRNPPPTPPLSVHEAFFLQPPALPLPAGVRGRAVGTAGDSTSASVTLHADVGTFHAWLFSPQSGHLGGTGGGLTQPPLHVAQLLEQHQQLHLRVIIAQADRLYATWQRPLAALNLSQGVRLPVPSSALTQPGVIMYHLVLIGPHTRGTQAAASPSGAHAGSTGQALHPHAVETDQFNTSPTAPTAKVSLLASLPLLILSPPAASEACDLLSTMLLAGGACDGAPAPGQLGGDDSQDVHDQVAVEVAKAPAAVPEHFPGQPQPARHQLFGLGLAPLASEQVSEGLQGESSTIGSSPLGASPQLPLAPTRFLGEAPSVGQCTEQTEGGPSTVLLGVNPALCPEVCPEDATLSLVAGAGYLPQQAPNEQYSSRRGADAPTVGAAVGAAEGVVSVEPQCPWGAARRAVQATHQTPGQEVEQAIQLSAFSAASPYPPCHTAAMYNRHFAVLAQDMGLMLHGARGVQSVVEQGAGEVAGRVMVEGADVQAPQPNSSNSGGAGVDAHLAMQLVAASLVKFLAEQGMWACLQDVVSSPQLHWTLQGQPISCTSALQLLMSTLRGAPPLANISPAVSPDSREFLSALSEAESEAASADDYDAGHGRQSEMVRGASSRGGHTGGDSSPTSGTSDSGGSGQHVRDSPRQWGEIRLGRLLPLPGEGNARGPTLGVILRLGLCAAAGWLGYVVNTTRSAVLVLLLRMLQGRGWGWGAGGGEGGGREGDGDE